MCVSNKTILSKPICSHVKKCSFNGVLYPEIYFLISIFFHNLNFKYVHINTKKVKKKILIKIPQGGYSTERPKLGVSGVKDTAKTNKDLGMHVMLLTGRIQCICPLVALL